MNIKRLFVPPVLVAGVCLVLPVGTAKAATAVPGPIYGVTIDQTSGLARVIADEATLPYRPTTRSTSM